MHQEQRKQLDQAGFILLKGVLSPSQLDCLRERLEELWQEEGEQAGIENYREQNTRRLANLVNKGDIFRLVLRHRVVMDAVEAVIGPDIRLSMLNARDVLPGSGPSQPFHSDADHGGKPDDKGYFACTAIWMLDDFTRQNGATRVIPGTHRSGKLPQEVMSDALALHPDEIVVEGKAGDVFVFNGHCWHAGGANMSSGARRAILAHYLRADQPQRLLQKEALSPSVKASMDPFERVLLGLDD